MKNPWVFPINSLPSFQLVKAGIDEILFDADLKYEAAQEYYRRVDADVLFYFSDIVVQAEAMGAKVRYTRGSMPAVSAAASVITVNPPSRAPRMVVNAEVLRRMAEDFTGRVRAALVYGPFTVAGQLMGEETLLRALVENSKHVLQLLEMTWECAARYGEYLVSAGANLVWVSDPLAALIPPSQFQDYCEDFLKRFFDLFEPLPTMLHICGDTSQLLDGMIATGVRGISFDNCMDLLTLEDAIPADVMIVGNLDPVEIVELSSRQEVLTRTADLVSMMALRENFVPSTGCAVPLFAPIDNVSTFVESAKATLSALQPHTPSLCRIYQGVTQGAGEAVLNEVKTALEQGLEPVTILNSGLIRGIRKGSALYEAKRCYLPTLLRMVDAFYKGFHWLKSSLKTRRTSEHRIVIGTVQGDIHEIGKNLVKILLETHGHAVIDLGVDVDVHTFSLCYQEYRPKVLALSAFTTTSRKSVRDIIGHFHSAGMRDVRFVVGGAAMNSEAARHAGADGYAKDAVGAVHVIEGLLNSLTPNPDEFPSSS